MAPNFIRPRSALSHDDVSRLVQMREAGATWKEIGRVFSKQDGACKVIFDKARASQVSAPG